jgi:ATP-binding protein involved in chromosome partitioning
MHVQEPTSKKDIVGLGFVKDVKVDGKKALLTLELPNLSPLVKEQIKKNCIQTLEKHGLSQVDVVVIPKIQAPTPGAQSLEKKNMLPDVKHILAVASGKGGVGKSTVSSNLALALHALGFSVGLLDADIYGPSIPLMFGLEKKPEVTADSKIIPLDKFGLKLMSMGFLSNENTPVIWRGPMVHQILVQFLSTVEWGKLDYLIIDLPPGTGDAQLTLTQQAPLSGAVIVTTPQDVSLIDARKGLKMFEKVSVPVLGIIENMSFYECKTCHTREDIFRHGGGKKTAQELKVPFLGEIPIDPEVVLGGDFGNPIVIKNPNSTVSKAYAAIAKQLVSQVGSTSINEQAPLANLNLTWKK